jgi:polyferredoxin
VKKITKIKIIRTIIQIIFFIFFPGLISIAFLGVKDLYVNIINGNYNQIIPDSFVIIILSILTIIAGRIFCGWMCIFGALNDWVYILSNKLFKAKYKIDPVLDKYLKYLKYIILILIVLLVWTNIVNLPSGSSPWDAYGQIFDIKTMLTTYLIGSIILGLIVIGAGFIERFFCRYLCPLGAIFAILSKLKIFKIHKEKSVCGNCKACTLKCSMGINLDSMNVINSGECIQCFNCNSICPKNNAKVKAFGEEINETALAAVTITTTIGVYSLTNAIVNRTENSNINNTSSTTESLSTNTSKSTSTQNSSSSTNTNSNASNTTNNTTSTTSSTTAKYKDGTYTGTGQGYRPNLTVSVTIKNDKITNIEITSNNETPSFLQRVKNVVPNEIISAQSTKVNTVSGATRSSNGIISAVEAALSKAKV